MPDSLAPDLAQRVKEIGERLVPLGPAPTGYALRVTGESPFQFAWRQDESENEILRGNGDPNGVQFAAKGRLYVERDVPALWQNTDGLSAWQLVGSGSSGFPITYDDGTYTYSIFIDGPGELTITQYPNASPTDDVTINFDTVDLNIDTRDFNLAADRDANISPTRDNNLGAGRNVNINATDNVMMTSLPTSDPAVYGALWNDSGTVKISL